MSIKITKHDYVQIDVHDLVVVREPGKLLSDIIVSQVIVRDTGCEID